MRKTSKLLILALLSLTIIFVAGSVIAGTIIPDNLAIDFRDSAWSGANGASSFTLGNVTVTAEGRLPQYQNYTLYQKDSNGGTRIADGFGIVTSRVSDNKVVGEVDEIEKNEHLVVSFEGGQYLTGAWITNLFDYSQQWPGENFKQKEYGFLQIFTPQAANPITIEFTAADGQYTQKTNGELWVDFGGSIFVQSVVFYPGSYAEYFSGSTDPRNEYSVAGFTAVPIPPSAMLFASGIIGLIAVRRKKA